MLCGNNSIPTSVGIIPTFVGIILTLVEMISIPQEDVLYFVPCVGIFRTKFNSVGMFPTKLCSIKLYTCRNHVPTQV